MMRTGGEEQVTGALAILMILAALVVVGSYALEIMHKNERAPHQAVVNTGRR
ncbi:MAG TPA: hypothetical protein VFK49_06910 [Stellaceae bacterium]|nr:hypothetical protein [Stellaceae bacterium]